MKHECFIQVRTYECDTYGHVNNAIYLHYLEYARYEYLKAIGFDYQAMTQAGYSVYISRVEIDYKKSALPDDKLIIISYPIKKGAVSGIIAQQIFREQELLTEAKVTWAFVNTKGIPTKIPPKWDVPGLKP
jgi:acyl-CoA thioester hydrolase